MSGLQVAWGGTAVAFDPPTPARLPTILTWSETDRVAGVRAAGSGPLAASPAVLRWLEKVGAGLEEGRPISFSGFNIRVTGYRPIPYATAAEALRKTKSALRRPSFAARRLAATIGRPKSLPLIVELERQGIRLIHLGQSLHRFVPEDALQHILSRHGTANVVVAGSDYDDEVATGRLLNRFQAEVHIIADLIGPVRRALGLPMRPPEACLGSAPAGTRILHAGATMTLSDMGLLTHKSPDMAGGVGEIAL